MNIIKRTVLLSYISTASVMATIITPALQTISKQLNISDSSAQSLVTIFLIGYMIGQLIYGPLANRFGRLAALRSGLLIAMVGSIMCLAGGYYHLFDLLYWGRFISALGGAAGMCCSVILVNELLSAKEAKSALSYSILSFSLGAGLSVYLGGMLTSHASWQLMFIFLFIYTLALFVSTFLFKEPLKQKQPLAIAHILKGISKAVFHRDIFVYSLFLGMVSVMSYCYVAAGPFITHHLLGLSPAQFGSWNTLTILGMVGGSFTAGYLLKRLDVKTVLWGSLGLASLGVVSLTIEYLVHSSINIWFFVNATWLYFTCSMLFPCGSYLASNAISDKANASSAMGFVNLLSPVVAVTVMGVLPMGHFAGFLLTVGGFMLVVVIAHFLLIKRSTEAVTSQ